MPERMQSSAERKGMVKAAAVIRKAAKARAPKDTGLLKLAIGQKVKRYKASSSVVGVVGARTRFRGKKVESIRGRGGRLAQAKPSKYAHLVEFGTVRSRPRPFLRPAWYAKKGEAFSALSRSLRETLRKEGKL